MTNNLLRRTHEHREGLLPGFTRKYGVKRLVYYEAYQDGGDAIYREKTMKEWRRDWKIALIEQSNPYGPTSIRVLQDSFAILWCLQGLARCRLASSGGRYFANAATSAAMGPGFRRGDNQAVMTRREAAAAPCSSGFACGFMDGG